jgi:hypothetical protein
MSDDSDEYIHIYFQDSEQIQEIWCRTFTCRRKRKMLHSLISFVTNFMQRASSFPNLSGIYHLPYYQITIAIGSIYITVGHTVIISTQANK